MASFVGVFSMVVKDFLINLAYAMVVATGLLMFLSLAGLVGWLLLTYPQTVFILFVTGFCFCICWILGKDLRKAVEQEAVENKEQE